MINCWQFCEAYVLLVLSWLLFIIFNFIVSVGNMVDVLPYGYRYHKVYVFTITL